MTIAFCLHLTVTTVAAYALSWLVGSLTPAVAVLSLLFGFWVGRRRARWFDSAPGAEFAEWSFRSFLRSPNRWIEIVLALFVVFAAYRHFGWMLFYSGGEWRTLHANNFGDLPLHMNYIRFLAEGAEFPPWNPIFSPEKLRYPIGIDLYNAQWEKLGVGMQTHLFLVGIFATIASLVALHAWAGWWGIGGFFFGGGWLAWNAALAGVPVPADAIAWKNLFLSVFITQRGMLFALPAGLLLLWSARRAFQGRLSLKGKRATSLGLIWGALALFHLHSFFAVSVILAGLAWIHRAKGASFRVLRKMMWVAVPIGTFFVVYLTDGFSKAGVTHWRPGWMLGSEGLVTFATVNFRFWLPLAIGLPILVLMGRKSTDEGRSRRTLFYESLFFLALFALFLNLMLAPWDWDNIKVLLWPYLGLLMVAHEEISSRLRALKWGVVGEAALAVLFLAPGLGQVGASLVGTRGAVSVGSVEKLSSQLGALASVPPSALLLAAPTHDHPLALLGRRRVLGYEGHLWSHGINSSSVARDVELVLRGNEGWRDAVKRLRATHIVWGPDERVLYGNSAPEWKTILPNVSRVAGYEIYEIR